MDFLEQNVKLKFVVFLLCGFVGGIIISYYFGGNSSIGNTDRWMAFTAILSTLLATFFIYTGFKIETVKENLVGTKKEVQNALEFGLQLQYSLSYLMKKELDKALEVLIVLKSEPFVLKDNNRLNTCYFFLANIYFELFKRNEDDEFIAKAYQFVDSAIEDETHPLKNEILEAFEKTQKSI